METINEPVLISLNKGESINIKKNPNYKHALPAYDCIGGNMQFETREVGYPKLYRTLGGLSKKANEMFWTIVEVKNYKTNIGVLKAANQSERNKISGAYKELRELDLLRRVKQNHYMINPKAMIPVKYFPECKAEYERLK